MAPLGMIFEMVFGPESYDVLTQSEIVAVAERVGVVHARFTKNNYSRFLIS